MLKTDKIKIEEDGAIGRLIFNNPARHNAVSVEMWEGMADALEHFEASDTIRVIVLEGAGGKAFVSGADITQFEKQRQDPNAAAEYDRIAGRATMGLANCSKPTIAKLNGYCMGGGVGIAITADMRIAADNTQFAIPAAKLGLGYGRQGITTLVDLVGPAYAKELFFSARRVNAEEALGMGLINRVVPLTNLDEAVDKLANQIAENAPLTVYQVKVTVNEVVKPGGGNKELCDALVAQCFGSEDYKEGRTAFMEKRKAQFIGK